jgi:hypothetical protein
MVKFTSPAVGEEQVVDVELDKATILMPIQTNYTPIDSKVLWNLDVVYRELNRATDGSEGKNGVQDEPTEGERTIHRWCIKLYSSCGDQDMQKS